MKKFLILFFCICLLSGCGSEKNTKQDSYSVNYMEAQEKIIDEIPLEEVKYFKDNFLDGYYLTLDEHTK